MANVSIRDVRKTFGTTEVLHGVSGDIDDGEFVILVWPIRLRQIHAFADDRRS
jgi:ABC-type sugar transport system ATPase subunit